jgi:hypothetical protein
MVNTPPSVHEELMMEGLAFLPLPEGWRITQISQVKTLHDPGREPPSSWSSPFKAP